MIQDFTAKGIEPEAVLRRFAEIAAIPHESGNTGAIRCFCEKTAEKYGLSHRESGGNLVVYLPAYPEERAKEAPVIVQGHLDMVAAKTAESHHDFHTEGLSLQTDGEWIFAEGTTLGGDDGIAVAYMLALMEKAGDPAFSRPPLELLFTADEEIGMLGASLLDGTLLAGRRLLNIDSEEEGVFVLGCAGGRRVTLTAEFPVEETEGWAVSVSLSGFAGGHSGTEIGKNRKNAITLLADLLDGVFAMMGETLPICSFTGGKQDNAIPREAEAVCMIPESKLPLFRRVSDEVFSRLMAGACPEDSGGVCRLTVEDFRSEIALTSEGGRTFLSFLRRLPRGVIREEPDMPGTVRTSLNLGRITLLSGKTELLFLVRSSSDAEKQSLIRELISQCETVGGRFQESGDYPAWEVATDPSLQNTARAVYRELFRKEPVTTVIHAGLECGILSGKLPGLQAISFGPDIKDIHTPDEKLSIASVNRTWSFLLKLLEKL